jgi:hypothetical protein
MKRHGFKVLALKSAIGDRVWKNHSFDAAGAGAGAATGAGAAGASWTGAAGRGFGAGFLTAANAGAADAAGRGDGDGAGEGCGAFAAVAGGRGVATGSGVIMLIGGIEADVGNSALVGRPVGTDGGRPAIAPTTAGAFQEEA